METWFNPPAALESILRGIAAELPVFGAGFDPDVRPADPRHGDFQANGVLPWAKANRQNPRALATTLAEALAKSGRVPPSVAAVEIAGPGFLNFRFSPEFLAAWLERHGSSAALEAGASSENAGRTVVVDFSSPNTAKQMHVGHIRSTVIGEALCRLLAFTGAKVIRDNHIGDWGTQFGKLILAIKREGYNLDAPGPDPIAELESLYKRGDALTKESEADLENARKELVLLQNGDTDSLRIWKKIGEVSYRAFEEIYRTLGVTFDHVLGESFYCDKVDRVYRELRELGIAEESDGALVVFHPGHPRFGRDAKHPQPFLIRKSDGASNYASTDLATALYRVEEWKADMILCVVGAPQADHFEQLGLTLERWFPAKGLPVPNLRHVAFGSVLGEDGKIIRTRSGESIKLKDLLAEAVERSLAVVREKSPDMPAAQQAEIARVIGLGAVRYADLQQNRTSDYIFSWDRMLALEGNTAPYLLYAVARIHNIFRKMDLKPGEGTDGASAPSTATELALARKLLQFGPSLRQTLSDLRPHALCSYLYELAGEFSAFYAADRVMVDEPEVRARRVLLASRTLLVLETGLGLLGLETLDRM